LSGRPTCSSEGRRFTIRPEKIQLLDEAAAVDGSAHVEDGRVRDVVYVGVLTRYHVELDRGGELMVVKQNLETSSSEALEARGRRVRVEWRPGHTYEITRKEEKH
jgi:ABC-type Fe3+/spermidine/putrescine transport system ATPase subunit